MWIDRKTYDDLRLDNAKLREEQRVLNEQNHTLRSTVEWFMVRSTQLEKERAVLINHYMGIAIETPDYRRAPKTPGPAEVPTNIPDLLGSIGFGDVGDEAAARMGIGWDKDGAVVATR